ncbi:MAG: Gfo/Idh/MocA family oxidoreductase [Chloroflexota bacterium]|nr:Gfo/Idh/MocA family oxidoreductase [Chloroflexota bacterium]
MATPFRLGIIGAGNLSSRRIYPCLHYVEDLVLAAVCDMEEARARRNAQKFGGERVYTDHREMLARAELDGVVVCVDPRAHEALAIEALEAGLPVYTEKPPAVTAAGARRVLEASERAGRLCMTAFKKRYAPAYVKAKEIVEGAEFGAPHLLSIDYASGMYRNNAENPRTWFLLDFGLHIIDLTRFLFGEVAEVFAWEREETAYAVSLRFANGAVGTLALTSHRDFAVSTEKVELTGGQGRMLTLANSVELTSWQDREIRAWHAPSFSTAGGDSLVETGFARELMAFVAACRGGVAPASTIASGYRTMLLYEAIRESAAAGGRTVGVPSGAVSDGVVAGGVAPGGAVPSGAVSRGGETAR